MALTPASGSDDRVADRPGPRSAPHTAAPAAGATGGFAGPIHLPGTAAPGHVGPIASAAIYFGSIVVSTGLRRLAASTSERGAQ